MNPSQGLTLPQPARRLWLKSRDIVASALEQIQGHEPEYVIGGGTILAARWRHRQSSDIDILVPANTPLHRGGDPDAGGFRERISGIGATAKYHRTLNKFKITFPDGGEIDLWARAPLLGSTTKREIVEGREVAVLSTAQILRGKLERGDLNLVRDVYDVLEAGAHDPKALEAAANAIPRPLAEGLAWSWHHASPTLAVEAGTELAGARESEDEFRSLGTRAAVALHAALYDTLAIQVSQDLITIGIRTTGGVPRTYTMSPDNADDEFEERGLNSHFANRRPGADVLREHAKNQARAGSETRTIYREERDSTTYTDPGIGRNPTGKSVAGQRTPT